MAYRQLRNAAKLATIGANANTSRTRPIIANAALNKDDYTNEILDKVKLLISKFTYCLQSKLPRFLTINSVN